MRIFLCLLALVPLPGLSQKYLDKSKSDVQRDLELFIKNNPQQNPTLQITDTTLILQLTEAGLSRQIVFGFDAETGKCSWEKNIAASREQYNKMLMQLIRQKTFRWKKINENQYISRFSDQLLIELPVDENNFSFTLFRTKWTKDLYNMLITN